MGIKLSELTSGTRKIDVSFDQFTIKVEYRLGERTPEKNAEMNLLGPVIPLLEKMLVHWDITSANGKQIPLTAKSMAKVPVPVLRAILVAVLNDYGLVTDQGEAESSSDAG